MTEINSLNGPTAFTTSHSHPAVKAIDDMLSDFGGHWPPRPSFDNWPESWQVYQQIADDMVKVCCDLNDATSFRQWMQQELKQKVNLEAVMLELESHMRPDNPVFLGFFSPITYMVHMYRWGTIPTTEEECKRTSIELPEAVWIPFTKMNEFWSLLQRGTAFSFCISNCCYDSAGDLVDMRFAFNHQPDHVQWEKNFFKSVAKMELIFSPVLRMIHEYLVLTVTATTSIEYAGEVLRKRVELLGSMRKQLVKFAQLFTQFRNDNFVPRKWWVRNVEALTAWNINGITDGASASESLAIHCLDEFLGIHGKTLMYKEGLKKRNGIPLQYREILNALREFEDDNRFSSFLGHAETEDPVIIARDDIIQLLSTIRLGHARVVGKYLQTSSHTSGRAVDNTLKAHENLATQVEYELRERARETKIFLSKNKHMCMGNET